MIIKQEILEKFSFITKKQRLFNERNFKIFLFSGYLTYLTLLTIDIILASMFGFTIVNNYISELGKASVIPFPLFHDSIAILGGVITIFSNLYFFRRLKTQYRPSKCSKEFVKIGLASGVVGAVAYIFLGIFSLDRAGPGEIYHGISMALSFGGFILSIFFYSLNIFLTHNCALRRVGIYGFTFPIVALIIYFLNVIPLTEWILFYSILAFYLPFDYYVFK